MVPRPEGLVERFVEIIFNDLNYTTLEIDINHINSGKGFSRKTNFTAIEIVNIAVCFLNGISTEMVNDTYFGDTYCQYYVCENDYGSKKMKMVFCICSDRPDRIGIITLHRI